MVEPQDVSNVYTPTRQLLRPTYLAIVRMYYFREL